MTEPEKFNENDDPRLTSNDGGSGKEPAVSGKHDDPSTDSDSGKPQTKPIYDVRKEIHGGPSGPQTNFGDNTPMSPFRLMLILFLVGALVWWFMNKTNPTAPISYGFFLEQLEADNLEKVVVNGNRVHGEFRVEPFIPEPDKPEKPEKKDGKVVSGPAQDNVQNEAEDEKGADSNVSASHPSQDPHLGQEKAPAPSVSPEASEGTAQMPAEMPAKKQQLNADADGNVNAGEGPQNASEQTAGEQVPEAVPSGSSSSTPETAGEKTSDAVPQNAERSERKRYPKRFSTTLPSLLEAGGELDKKIRERVGKKYEVKEALRVAEYVMLGVSILVLFMMVSFWMHFRKTREELGGGQMFGFGKSPAKRFQGGEDSVTFADVAGLKSVKEDISEIVDFLQNPKKFEKLGARIPKGVLMCGPPGTGKTLLARAIAGEAGVPFYSINASEFIQLFVGVGASRVRDMFDVARNNAPSILFIDEIDSVGRERGAGTGGGNDEREQTLNQILSEMDGFSTKDVVIVIAATNRPDVLDPALLRPGRFDRHVTVDRPVQKDRIQLFQVHTKKVPLNKDVDFDRLAAMTTGLTGADIRNIVNEAALWACRFDRENVSMSDFYYAIDKILMGAKREEVISAKDKEKTSYHEAGHALVGWLIPECDRVRKVSVIPRGRALGVTWSMPDEDRMMYSQEEILANLKMMLGGREAEKLVFNELNAGAANDLERATGLAHKMVAAWGMSSRLGPVAFKTGDEHPFLGRELARIRNFSEKTAQVIDEEVMRILNETSLQVQTLLTENRNLLDALAQALMIREELDEKQIEDILGPSAHSRENDQEEGTSTGETGDAAVSAATETSSETVDLPETETERPEE